MGSPSISPRHEDPNKGKSRGFKHPLVIAAGIVVAGALLFRVLPPSAARTEVQYKFGDQVLKLNVQKDMSNPEALIHKLMSQPYSKAGILALLKQEGVYSITDPAIASALQRLCPDQGPAGETLLQRQKRLQPCFDESVVKDLRDLASRHEGVFQYRGQVVRIGTPADTQPMPGKANVCEYGGLLGREIEIDTMPSRESIIVDATGYYPCTTYSTGIHPDIQLSAKDALRLFGRPTRKFEKAIAVIM